MTHTQNSLSLVDLCGRAVPKNGMTGVVNPNRRYRLIQPRFEYGQPRFEYADRMVRLRRSFIPDMTFVSAIDFESRSKNILARIANDRRVANLLFGAYLPICIPQMQVRDYGITLNHVFVESVRRAYSAEFPMRSFDNCLKGALIGRVKVAVNTRHDLLVQNFANDPVVGVYFPMALHGFGIEASRQMIRAFPKDFVLSGALDIATAMMAYPDIMARDGLTPVFDCAANVWSDPVLSLCFQARGTDLRFDVMSLSSSGSHSSGVLVLG